MKKRTFGQKPWRRTLAILCSACMITSCLPFATASAKTVDGLALRCGFSAPCEGRFLNMKNPSIRHGERDDTMSDFEILSLVIMTAGLIVQILIYIKKK